MHEPEDIVERAFAPAARAVDSGAIPCAALGVVTREGKRAVRFAGAAAREPEHEALTREHWFDLASLTKVIATTPAVIRLAEQGTIDLDATLASAIPDLRQYDTAGAPERRLTFRQCLTHATHLPGVEPIYTYGSDPDTLRAFVLQRAWKPGPSVYSDINFILLGIAIERLTGGRLNDLPLGESLRYGQPPGPAVATEQCTWRRRVLKGEVHDENAFALGGASGHAGLFGTVDGVLGFASTLLDGSACSPAMLEAMRTPVFNDRTLGWQSRYAGWHGGEACSVDTIGHTGFTGTGLWIDFESGLAWTLLTNRVHPTRHRETGIAALRVETGNAVSDAAG
ncbi:serine hydrolase domain-containing protein [Pararhizobium mangrovi]|uniref:Serine hydrolase n=1 Tax=Pararhizobium mangrovi TaxID=2590452 RepID=A0A506TZZ3_9HYPH|nr:serine hydrolase [Pararhizobium mangrovi]TPW26314.1 serine hydrolase [Pararhizobium mangrovi]